MTIWFQRRETPTGSEVYAFDVQPIIEIASEFLDRKQLPDVVSRDGDVVTITCANGKWIYRIVDLNPLTGVYTAQWPD